MPAAAKKAHSRPNPARELVFGDLWEFDPAPETADPKLKKKYDLFINGRFVPSRSGKYFTTINPATEAKIADIALADASDIDAACSAAQRAFITWSACKYTGAGLRHAS